MSSSSSSSSLTLYDLKGYKFSCTLVQHYIKARNRDLLPDEDTERALGMKGERGRLLYGAMKTLYLHGRFSRTMMEYALCSTTPSLSYPEYIPLLLSSLPPEGRSMYAANLYDDKYRGLEWPMNFYRSISKEFIEAGLQPPLPPIPIGDDRHSPKMASIVKYADDFYTILNNDVPFDTDSIRSSPDLHAKLDPDYVEMLLGDYDSLVVVGPCFGVQKSDLDFDDGTKDQHSEMSPSEVILRVWNLMYQCERLCKTELECALLQGPDGAGGVKALFSNGLELVTKFPICWPTNDSCVMTSEAIQDLIRRASSLDLDTIEFAPVPQPGVASGDQEEISTMMECDYCGDPPPKTLYCSHCHVAMYCGRECQQGDWKRHKPLCSRYQARCNQHNTAMPPLDETRRDECIGSDFVDV